MPLPAAPIDAPTLTSYADLTPNPNARDQGRYHLTADGGIVWPCPRCATTLRARPRQDTVIHDCPDTIPKPSPRQRTARARLVNAWWDAFHAALDLTVCTRDHVPPNAHVILPTYNGLVAVTAGDWPTSYYLPDAGREAANWQTNLPPVERAVLIARLRAWADVLDTPQDALAGADQ